MKVLLLYQYLNHTSTVTSLAKHMRTYGIEIDCLDLPTLSFTSGRKGRFTVFRSIYLFWQKYGKLRRVFSAFLRTLYISAQLKDYDVVDIHSYDLYYNNLIPIVKKRKIPLIIMVWGSDFYRATPQKLERKRFGFAQANIIHLESESVEEDFLKVFPEFSDKIRIVQFGLEQLDLLKEAMKQPLTEPSIIPSNIYKKKIIVTCGYNGIESQQHLIMINAISMLSKSLRDSIHLIIPFTYGGKPEYKDEVITLLTNSDVSYTLLDKRLSDSQVTELRRISQVVINIQKTDSFSASLQEHMMAGSVMIVGDWLPYQMFDKVGLYMIKTSISTLQNNIERVLNDFEEYRIKSVNNTQRAYDFSSWHSVEEKWVDIYKSLK